jgi:hypothetical protein
MPKNAFLMPQIGPVERLALSSFGNEDELHSLVEQIPELLDECLSEPAGQWLLVRREMGIPDSAAGPDRWAVDLFLLDSNGVPTFVEVKRSRDPRARREVVAQMLDYAANGSSYLSVTEIRNSLRESAEKSPELLQIYQNVTSGDSEIYWQNVEAKLAAGNVRLIFVADQIHSELRRLVEFLNEKMPDLQVLALEVRLFKIGERRVVIGDAIGNTIKSQDAKGRQSGTQPVPSDLTELLERLAFSDTSLSEKLKTLFAELGSDNTYIRLAASQFTFGAQTTSGRVQIVGISRKSVWLALDSLQRLPALADEGARRTLLGSLETIMGRRASTENLRGYPSFDVTLLSDDGRRAKFADFVLRLITGPASSPTPQSDQAVQPEDHPA